LLAARCGAHVVAFEVVEELAQVAVSNALANGAEGPCISLNALEHPHVAGLWPLPRTPVLCLSRGSPLLPCAHATAPGACVACQTDVLTVVNAHSTDTPSATAPRLPPLTVIVAELLDTGLIGEGVLPSMRHAVSRLMQAPVKGVAGAPAASGAPGTPAQRPRCIPAAATVFATLVESSTLWAQHALARVGATDAQPPRPAHAVCPGAASPFAVSVAALRRSGALAPLSDPCGTPVLEFDFGAPPGSQGRHVVMPLVVTQAGEVHGVVRVPPPCAEMPSCRCSSGP
jgi:hypothetical protein